MLSRERCIVLLAQHTDVDEGGVLDQAHDAVVERLGWRAFTDEALSLMASEVLRLSGQSIPTDPAEDALPTSRRRH
jgi:hypothetical protein